MHVALKGTLHQLALACSCTCKAPKLQSSLGGNEADILNPAGFTPAIALIVLFWHVDHSLVYASRQQSTIAKAMHGLQQIVQCLRGCGMSAFKLTPAMKDVGVQAMPVTELAKPSICERS